MTSLPAVPSIASATAVPTIVATAPSQRKVIGRSAVTSCSGANTAAVVVAGAVVVVTGAAVVVVVVVASAVVVVGAVVVVAAWDVVAASVMVVGSVVGARLVVGVSVVVVVVPRSVASVAAGAVGASTSLESAGADGGVASAPPATMTVRHETIARVAIGTRDPRQMRRT